MCLISSILTRFHHVCLTHRGNSDNTESGDTDQDYDAMQVAKQATIAEQFRVTREAVSQEPGFDDLDGQGILARMYEFLRTEVKVAPKSLCL